MPPRLTEQRVKKVQRELDALYEQRALKAIEAHLDKNPELVPKVLTMFALGAWPVLPTPCSHKAGRLIFESSSPCDRPSALRTNSFDPKASDAAGSADVEVLPRSYWRFSNLPAKKVDALLVALEPDCCSVVDLATLRDRVDHHRLLWFALDVRSNSKIPTLPERTWPALLEWAMDSYKAAGARLRRQRPRSLLDVGHVEASCQPAAHSQQRVR